MQCQSERAVTSLPVPCVGRGPPLRELLLPCGTEPGWLDALDPSRQLPLLKAAGVGLAPIVGRVGVAPWSTVAKKSSGQKAIRWPFPSLTLPSLLPKPNKHPSDNEVALLLP